MSQAPRRISIAEDDARKLTLAHAVEATDTQGKLLSVVEREAIDRQISQSIRPVAADDPAQIEALLRNRAGQVLDVVTNRNPALAALGHPRRWTRWLAVAAPLAAVLLGAATDRIANPHRVDLLSLPLLTIVGWNLAVYAALLLAYILQRKAHQSPRPSPVAELAQRLAAWHPRAGGLQARVTAVFFQKWYAATSALQAQRVRKVLHLSAAGWALGVVLSLFTRGLVVEYRVGWESTFLNADQVYAAVKVLLLPVLALFPFQSFSVQDIAALRFSDAATPASSAGARWVYLYATLLGLVVMAPRLLLALWARWRAWQLAREVTVDLDTAYYRRIVAMTNPARIQLGLLAVQDDDYATLLRVLQPRAEASDAMELAPDGSSVMLIRASGGETLSAGRMAPSGHAKPPPFSRPARAGWAGLAIARFRGAPAAVVARPAATTPAQAADSPDVALILLRSADDLDAALPLLRQHPAPTLLLVRSRHDSPAQQEADLALCRTRANGLGLDAEALPFGSVAACWVQQPILLDAIGRCLPAAKKEGFARLVETRTGRNRARFAQSMTLIARQLTDAARETEAVRTAPPSLTRLIKSADRQADAQARAEATAALSARLQAATRHTQTMLLRLHGIEGNAHELVEHTLEDTFRHTAPINAREAGMAGAATGAATGASVDLITGGLTLGAAAALGALVGGGAALAGAAWKNRSTPPGAATLQLTDDMLHALLNAALLRYLAVVHLEGAAGGPASADTARSWAGPASAVLAQHQSELAGLWTQARQPVQPPGTADRLNAELEAVMRELLHTLYPAAPLV